MAFPKGFEYLIYDFTKETDIYNFGVYESKDRESLIYKKSYKFLMKNDDFLYSFYDFQLLLELITRFQGEMNISDRSLNYLNVANEDIKLSFRFQLLGYYNTSGIHLRGFFEKVVHFIIFHNIDSGLIKEFAGKGESFIKKSLKDKINKCLEIGELSLNNIDNKNKEVYDKYYFPTSEVLKLYGHYSYDYVHDGKPTSYIQFDENEFKQIHFLMKLTFIFIGRFISITIGETIEKYWVHKVLKQIGEHPYYWNYLQYFFGYNKVLTNQFSYIYNLIHDDSYIKEFVFNKLNLIKENLFSKEYLERIDINDKLWKKSGGNRDKYLDLLVEYYDNTG